MQTKDYKKVSESFKCDTSIDDTDVSEDYDNDVAY
jgi:hypothetical protein